MKRSIILGVIAVVLLVVSIIIKSNDLSLLFFVLLFAIVVNEYHRRHHIEGIEEKAKPYERTVDDLMTKYGNPEDVILLNATRANEAMGVILAYKDFLVVEGSRIEKRNITDVTFNNSGTPYARDEYQVIIAAGPSRADYIHVKAGYDAAWAKDVVEQIKQNL